jgi:CubicO group peptidase (beta-lactamase class C family)
LFKAAPRKVLPSAELGNRTDVLSADIPAGGKMSARAAARMYAALLGEVDGVRLISPERLRLLSAVVVDDVDQVYGDRGQSGLGFFIGGPSPQLEETPTAFGVPGAGGSHAYADTASGIAFALNKNRLTMQFDAVERITGIVAKSAAGR